MYKNKLATKTLIIAAFMALSACNLMDSPIFDDNEIKNEFDYYDGTNQPIKGRSVVVCRSKQCAPAKLSMSREYIHNSLLHLFDNNNRQTALICEADAASHTCTENYVTIPVKVGITPAHLYIDSVKIIDSMIEKDNKVLKLVLNYNVTFNGQKPECVPAQSILFVKHVSNIVMEDPGYSCKMTAVGQTSVKTLFAIDYVDLDYGFIGGFYSIGASGPAYGGGTGYMMLRLPGDAYPLDPALMSPQPKEKDIKPAPKEEKNTKQAQEEEKNAKPAQKEQKNTTPPQPKEKDAKPAQKDPKENDAALTKPIENTSEMNPNVQVFPINN